MCVLSQYSCMDQCEESTPLLDGVRECLSNGSWSGSEPDCHCMFQFSVSTILNTSVYCFINTIQNLIVNVTYYNSMTLAKFGLLHRSF